MSLELFKHEVYPVDYPTGSIIDSLIKHKQKKKFNYLVLNFKTLVRNFLTALDPGEIPNKSKEKLKLLKSGEYRFKLLKDFRVNYEILANILKDEKIEFVVYYNEYKNISKCLDNYLIDEKLTAFLSTVEKYSKSFKKPLEDDDTIKFEKLPRYEAGNGYVLFTHNAVDLTIYENAKDVYLIESFTGEIKGKEKWYTKYRPIGDKNMSIFPFNSYLLTLLGCKNYIKGGKIKLRKKIYEIALSCKWNPNTTKDKVKLDMGFKDKMLHNLVKHKDDCYKKI